MGGLHVFVDTSTPPHYSSTSPLLVTFPKPRPAATDASARASAPSQLPSKLQADPCRLTPEVSASAWLQVLLCPPQALCPLGCGTSVLTPSLGALGGQRLTAYVLVLSPGTARPWTAGYKSLPPPWLPLLSRELCALILWAAVTGV